MLSAPPPPPPPSNCPQTGGIQGHGQADCGGGKLNPGTAPFMEAGSRDNYSGALRTVTPGH